MKLQRYRRAIKLRNHFLLHKFKRMKIQLLIDGDSQDEDIRGLIAHLNGSETAGKTAGAKTPVKEIKKETPPAGEQGQEEPGEETDITLDSIRALFVAKAGKGGKKKECAALLTKYKTTSITDLDTKYYVAFTKALNAL